MKWIHLILILSLWAPNQAQTNLDSLWAVWLNKNQPDTIRLAAMDEYTKHIAQTHNPDSVIQKAMLMLDLAIKNNNRHFQARSYEALGDAQMRKPEMAEAAKTFTIAIKLFEEINNRKRIAACLWNLGLVYYQMGQYSKALDNYTRSLAIYEEPEIPGNTSGLLNNIGLIYKHQKNYTQALEYFIKSTLLAEEQGWSNETAKGNIGGIYLEQGEYDKALHIFQEKLKNAQIGQGYYSNLGMYSAYQSIADVYVELGNYDLALSNYLLSLDHAYKDSISIGTKQIETKIGLFYERIGNAKLAIEWCSKGLLTAKTNKAIQLEHISCECLYKAYKKQGDETSALEYFERFHMLNDSLKLEETAKSLQKMEFAKQMLADSLKQAEENQRIELLHKNEVLKKDKTRNILISLGAILFLLAIGLFSRNRYVNRAKNAIEEEKKRSDNLLLNILPAEIAEELKDKGEAAARDFELVSVLFTDFKGFTQASAKLSAADLVDEINTCFKAFDIIVDKYGIEKIKTIGDAYMAAGGLPVQTNDSAKNTVLAALEMQEFIGKRKTEHDIKGLPAFEMRAGIHTGPVVAGIVGVKKFQYDIWGDTVNTASRMESSGEVGKVNVSKATYGLLKDDDTFRFESRGKIDTKGKGKMEMWFVQKEHSSNKTCI